jgi:excinuclease UvrABC ATPase subunit
MHIIELGPEGGPKGGKIISKASLNDIITIMNQK